MSLSTYHRLGLGDLRDRSSVHPRCVLADVLVKVKQFILPVEFIDLDFEENLEIPILLRGSFSITSRTTIDVDGCPNMVNLSTSLIFVCHSTCSLFSHATN